MGQRKHAGTCCNCFIGVVEKVAIATEEHAQYLEDLGKTNFYLGYQSFLTQRIYMLQFKFKCKEAVVWRCYVKKVFLKVSPN